MMSACNLGAGDAEKVGAAWAEVWVVAPEGASLEPLLHIPGLAWRVEGSAPPDGIEPRWLVRLTAHDWTLSEHRPEEGGVRLAEGSTVAALEAALRRALASHIEARSTAAQHEGERALWRGRGYQLAGDLRRAVSQYHVALAHGRDDYALRLALGQWAERAGDAAGALLEYRAAFTLPQLRAPLITSLDGAAHAGAGRAAEQLGRWDLAASYYETAVSRGHDPGEVQSALVRVYERQGNAEQAWRAREAAAAAGCEHAEIYRALALRNEQAGELQGALDLWQRVVTLEPKDTRGVFELGRLQLAQGDLDAARPHLEKAARSKAHRAAAHRLLAQLAARESDPSRAFAHLEVVASLEPASFELLAELGVMALQAGQTRRAQTYLTRALAFRPGDGATAFHLGRMALDEGRADAAEAFLSVAAAARYRSGDTYRLLGEAAAQRGDRSAMITAYQRAYRAGAGGAEVHRVLGLAAHEAGERERALRHYREAIREALTHENGRPIAAEVYRLAQELGAEGEPWQSWKDELAAGPSS